MVTMVIVAPHLVGQPLGPQWTGAVLHLQILCVGPPPLLPGPVTMFGVLLPPDFGRVSGQLRTEAVYAVPVYGGRFWVSHYGPPVLRPESAWRLSTCSSLPPGLLLNATGASFTCLLRSFGCASTRCDPVVLLFQSGFF